MVWNDCINKDRCIYGVCNIEMNICEFDNVNGTGILKMCFMCELQPATCALFHGDERSMSDTLYAQELAVPYELVSNASLFWHNIYEQKLSGDYLYWRNTHSIIVFTSRRWVKYDASWKVSPIDFSNSSDFGGDDAGAMFLQTLFEREYCPTYVIPPITYGSCSDLSRSIYRPNMGRNQDASG